VQPPPPARGAKWRRRASPRPRSQRAAVTLGLAHRQGPLRQQAPPYQCRRRQTRATTGTAPAFERMQRETHVIELEHRFNFAHARGSAAQQERIVLRGCVHRRDGNRDVVEAEDHARVPPLLRSRSSNPYHEQPSQSQPKAPPKKAVPARNGQSAKETRGSKAPPARDQRPRLRRGPAGWDRPPTCQRAEPPRFAPGLRIEWLGAREGIIPPGCCSIPCTTRQPAEGLR
jgi:hypothetical protein